MLHLLSEIGNTWFMPWENSFILWFQSIAGKDSFLYYLMNFISMFGEEMILVGIVGLIYWGLDKKGGEQVGFMMISTTLVNPLIKNIVCRTRPFDSATGIQNFRDVDGYSFPSGHSSGSSSTLVGTTVVYRKKKWKWLIAISVVIPVLVALSRTYLGAHYPSDVVCGLALGVGMVFLVNLLYTVLPNKYWLYGGFAVLGLAGFFYCTTSDFFTAYGLLIGFICGLLFEEKITKFENTKTWWRIVLRVLVGGGLFFGLNELLKVLVGVCYHGYKDDLWFERVFRTFRYAVVTFAMIGVYPMLFAQTEKLWKKLGWIKDAAETTAPDETTNAEIETDSDDKTTTVAQDSVTLYDVIIKSVSDKLKAIKTVRTYLNVDLEEAKQIVENVPTTVKLSKQKDIADKMVKELTDNGAEAESVSCKF